MVKYCIRKKSNPIEYWAGYYWTVADSEIALYTVPKSVPPDGELVALTIGKDYPSSEAIFERVKTLCSNVFGKCLVELNNSMVSANGEAVTDPSVSINGRIEIFWSEDTRLPRHAINGSTLEPGYMVNILHTIPATRRAPQDCDIEEMGTYSSLEDAVKKAVELEAVFRVNDYLDYEADMRMAEDEAQA